MPINLTPSDEQRAIVEHVRGGRGLRILALAGTGKTTTLQFIAEALAERSVLYIVFNKSQQIAAQRRFADLPNVRPATINSLAYGAAGYAFKDRLEPSDYIAQQTWYDFMCERDAFADLPVDQWMHAFRSIAQTLKRFMASADGAIGPVHVPATDLDRETIVHLTRRLWSTLASNDAMPVTHDFYVKLYQLSKPVIRADVLLFDEAQDLTPANLAIGMGQTQAQLVYCGDAHQQLYEFRGAVNALDTIDLPALALTETRRFGPQIAAAANAILAAKGETMRVRGIGSDEGVVREGYRTTNDAVVARSNAGLVERALVLIEAGRKVFIRGAPDRGTGRAANGAGDLMSSLLSAFDLRNGRPASHPLFRAFQSWEDVVRASEDEGGETLRPFVRLADKHASDVPRVVARIRDGTVADEATAEVVLSTVHRIKGDEFASVALGGDFHEFVDKNGAVDAGEANVAYVALTRAQNELCYGGAYKALNTSTERKGVVLPSTPVPVRAYVPPEPKRAAPWTQAPAKRAFKELAPGTHWDHPVYGRVTIEDATAQLVRLRTVDGDDLQLATLPTYAKLTAAE
jgi:hypothetical protein